jgi:hypothetical protein
LLIVPPAVAFPCSASKEGSGWNEDVLEPKSNADISGIGRNFPVLDVADDCSDNVRDRWLEEFKFVGGVVDALGFHSTAVFSFESRV